MEDADLLSEVINSLEQDSNVLRIKRLLLFTCRNLWSNDVNAIKALSIEHLIREVMIMFPELDELKQRLNGHIKQLSKQSEYLLAADCIIDNIGFLYSLRDEGQLPADFLRVSIESNDAQVNGQIESPAYNNSVFNIDDNETIPHIHHIKYLTNLFDLRVEITRNISPLHAKILLFSALNYRFSPKEKDWSPLYSHDLDDLIQMAFQSCSSSEELQDKLTGVSKTLDLPEDAQRAAMVIVQALRPLYSS